VKYAWITRHRDSFPVTVLCDVLRVSASGYHASLDRTPSPRAQRHERIQQAVHRSLELVTRYLQPGNSLRERQDLSSS
jgi:putative transposase